MRSLVLLGQFAAGERSPLPTREDFSDGHVSIGRSAPLGVRVTHRVEPHSSTSHCPALSSRSGTAYTTLVTGALRGSSVPG